MAKSTAKPPPQPPKEEPKPILVSTQWRPGR